MKYGILTHIGFSKKGDDSNRIISMGDVLECLAIRNLYRSMGISEDELQVCYPYELNDASTNRGGMWFYLSMYMH